MRFPTHTQLTFLYAALLVVSFPRVVYLLHPPFFSYTRVWTSPETGTRACSDRFTRSQRVCTVHSSSSSSHTHTHTHTHRREFLSVNVRYSSADPANRLLLRQNKTWWKSPKVLCHFCLLALTTIQRLISAPPQPSCSFVSITLCWCKDRTSTFPRDIHLTAEFTLLIKFKCSHDWPTKYDDFIDFKCSNSI